MQKKSALAAVLVFVMAAILRPLQSVVGPLLPNMGADLGLGEGLQGLLTTVPLIAFGVVSLVVPCLVRKIGIEVLAFLALIGLALGTVLRSLPLGLWVLWIGTTLIGICIGIGNVLGPAFVSRDYPKQISRATGLFSAILSAFAALGAILAVPVANAVGWRVSLAFWLPLVVVTAILWVPRMWSFRGIVPEHGSMRQTMRRASTWWITLYVGLQSALFFIYLGWLPTIAVASGESPAAGGVAIFCYQIAGIVGSIVVSRHIRDESQSVVAAIIMVPCALGTVGLIFLPHLIILWSIVAGAGSGASLVVSLAMIGISGRQHGDTEQLSGIAQSFGYFIAACGPFGLGLIVEHGGTWTLALSLVAIMCGLHSWVGLKAGARTRNLMPLVKD
ncbi:MAG: MFS transporter [Actinomycetaceae bacterium]|nr:MFS transporter [Actinomycetaceae bacterium]